jgi:hypothetical protein
MRRLSPPLRFGLPLALAVVAAPAAASPSWHLGVRLGGFEPAASETHDLLYGGDTVVLAGGQVEIRFDRGWFLALSGDHGSVDGELVAPAPGGGVLRTGTSTELTLTPVHLTIGGAAGRSWQFLYGGGPSLLIWEDDNVLFPSDGSDVGLHAVIGVRRDFARASLGGELRWSTFPDTIGSEGGVSEAIGEDDLGGLALGLVVGFRLGR